MLFINLKNEYENNLFVANNENNNVNNNENDTFFRKLTKLKIKSN